MEYINLSQSLSNYVVFDNYEKEHFKEEEWSCLIDDHLHKQILKNMQLNSSNKLNNLDNCLKKVFVPKSIIKQNLKNSSGGRLYNPLRDTPELFLELNKLELFNENQLDKFIKEYGIPYHEYIDSKDKGIFNSNLFKKNAYETALRAMDVLVFYEKLLEYKKVITIWNNISQNNVERLEEIKEDFRFKANFNENQRQSMMNELSTEEYSDYVCATLGIFEDEERKLISDILKNNPGQISLLQEKASAETATWRKVQSGSIKEIGLAYLNLQLNKLETGVLSTTYIDGMIVPAVSFQNLLEVAAFQLKQAIFKNIELKICLNCNALYAPRHASQKFCSPLPSRKRSTCENTYNQRKKRNKKKQELERS